ncbi:hypothetical protein [Paraburkholderia sp. GAS41]|uniref:hypothetical protein n=1 Tax=Paraburkholderia sp. GAS41 TaxID=3035134 RepID=UPI003D1F1818
MAAKTLDFAITAYKVCNGLSYVRDVRANLLAQDAAGVDIPPELQGKVEECWRAACAAVQQVLAQCNGLARENEAEKTAAAQAAQAEVVPTAESVAAGEEDDTMETNSGQVPHSGATSGALDAAATDAGRKAILAHAQSVSSLHVPTVDAATRLQIEQANARKQSLQRAIANGDELEAIRLRFGLDRTTSTDPVGDFMRALKG